MGMYYQPRLIPVELIIDDKHRTVTLIGKATTITLRPGRNIEFNGLDVNFQVYKVFPNGATLIDSDTSVPRFYSWHKLLMYPNSIWLDALNVTGYISCS